MSKTFKDRRRQFDTVDDYLKFKQKKRKRFIKREKESKDLTEKFFEKGILS